MKVAVRVGEGGRLVGVRLRVEPDVAGELADWQRRTGVAIDPSYA
ncbi:MAG: hypothetical protein ACRDUX_07525 [Mycobacterium sp.]